MARRSARSTSSTSKSGRSERAGRSTGRTRRSARAEEEPEEDADGEEPEEEEDTPDEDIDEDDADGMEEEDGMDGDEDPGDDDEDGDGEDGDEDEGGGGRRSSRRRGKSGRSGSRGKGKASSKSREPREERQPRERAVSEPVSPGKAIAMTVFLGMFGAGRFVMGYTGVGIAQIGLTILMLLGLLLPPYLLEIPQGFWFTLPYLALVGNATVILHDLLLLGSGLMKDARGRPIQPAPPEGKVEADRSRDRAYQMGLFGGLFGVARFYLGDMVRGGIHLGLTVVGLVLVGVAMPSWVGMRDYRVSGTLHYEEVSHPQTGLPVFVHHITVDVFPQETPLEEVGAVRERHAAGAAAYFSEIAELRREERLPHPYLPEYLLPDAGADAGVDAGVEPEGMVDEPLGVEDELAHLPREERAKVEDGLPVFPDEHVTIRRIHDASSAPATEARLRAERRKAENRVWRGFVEGRPDEEGRIGQSALQAVLDLYEHPPLHLRRPALGIAGLVLLLASLFLWVLDLIAFGGGEVKTAAGKALGFSEVHPRFAEKHRGAMRHIEVGVVMFIGAFFIFLVTVYTGWPNPHGQPSLLEGVQIGFFSSLMLLLLFGGFGGYHLFTGERLLGEIRDEKLALMRALDKRERDAQQGSPKKGAPAAPPRAAKAKKKTEAAPVKKSASGKAAPPVAKSAPPTAGEEGDADAEPTPKKKAPRVRRRRRM